MCRYGLTYQPQTDKAYRLVLGPRRRRIGLTPSFLLRLSNDDELIFNFHFQVHQSQSTIPNGSAGATSTIGVTDTSLTGLTFMHASNLKELDNLVTKEFHANPNIHKKDNVELLGDYATNGAPSAHFQWSWRWRPPKATEDKAGGWRNSCCVSLISLTTP